MSVELIRHALTQWVYPALLVVFFFGLTIFLHEFGHFWMAKRRKMVIERFSIGFGPKIFGWTKDGIDYRVSWIPFGGYVALPQMSPMEALEGKTETEAAQLPPAPPSSKILVACCGPVMNILLATVLACLIWQVGLAVPVNPSIVGWVEPGSVEEQLGIHYGDRIVKVNDQPVTTWMEIHRAVALSLESDVRLSVARGDQTLQFVVPTETSPEFGIKMINLYSQGRPYVLEPMAGSPAEAAGLQPGDRFLAIEDMPVASAGELVERVGSRAGKPTRVRILRQGEVRTVTVTPRLDPRENLGRMGVRLGDEMEFVLKRPGPSPLTQFGEVFQMLGDTFYAVAHHKQTGVGLKSFSGPVGIAGGWWWEIRSGGITRGLKFAVLINLALAVFNLLPIPVLDGGHIVFALAELVRRRPVNPRLAHAVSLGFATLLIGFMLYVTFFDIQRFFGRPSRSAEPPAARPPLAAPAVPTEP